MNIYGILIGIALVIGIELIHKYSKYLTYKDILFSILLTLLGARILFLLHNIEEIREGIINPINIWEGGLAFYGGLIGLLLSLLILSKYKKIQFLKLSDYVLLFLPLIQSVGRIGNFFNYELYGRPTNLPWKIFIPQQYRIEQYIQYSYFHPVFLYESILNIFNFLLLLVLKKKNRRTGVITAIYLINYSIIRLFTNTIRVDKEYLLNIETSDLFSYLFLLSGILIILNMKNSDLKNKLARFISKELTLSLILIAILIVMLGSNLTITLNLVLAFLSFVIPLLTIILFKKFGLTSDYNVTKREERPKLFLIFAICFGIALYILIKNSESTLILIYTILSITFFLGFLITLFWKISFHMIWSSIAIFIIIYVLEVPSVYSLILFLPLIGWSRLQLKKHSLTQIVAGGILPLLCILLVLTFLKF